MSTNAGATWNFVDPTPGDRRHERLGRRRPSRRHHRSSAATTGICRSTDGGATWTTATTAQPLPGGTLLARGLARRGVRPVRRRRHVRSSRPTTAVRPGRSLRQSRRRKGAFRSSRPISARVPPTICGSATSGCIAATCTTPNPAAPGGAQRCNASAAWAARSRDRRRPRRHRATSPSRRASPSMLVPCSSRPTAASTATLRREPRLPHARVGAADRHAACALELHLLRRLAAWRGGRGPVFRQPGQRHLRHDQRRRRAGHLDERAVLRRLRRRRRRHSRADDDLLLFAASRRPAVSALTRLFVSGPGLTGASPEIGTYPPGNMQRSSTSKRSLNFGPDDLRRRDHDRRLRDVEHRRVADRLDAARRDEHAGQRLRRAAWPSAGGTPTFFVKSGGCDGDAPARCGAIRAPRRGDVAAGPDSRLSEAFGVLRRGSQRPAADHRVASRRRRRTAAW